MNTVLESSNGEMYLVRRVFAGCFRKLETKPLDGKLALCDRRAHPHKLCLEISDAYFATAHFLVQLLVLSLPS